MAAYMPLDDRLHATRWPQMLRTPDAWLLCGVGSVVIGGGNFLATNMGQVTALDCT